MIEYLGWAGWVLTLLVFMGIGVAWRRRRRQARIKHLISNFANIYRGHEQSVDEAMDDIRQVVRKRYEGEAGKEA